VAGSYSRPNYWNWLQDLQDERKKEIMDFLEYLDEVYEELVDEFGHEIESKCVHE
jgi:hypothetical protein